MATVFQVIQLYRRILDYLMPLEMGILGWGANRFLGNSGDLDSAYSRPDDINGRFFYTGLGSAPPGGGFVPEKIRGDVFTRNAGGVSGWLGVGGWRGISGVSGVDGVSGVGSMRDVGGVGSWRGGWNYLSAWNVWNDSIRGMDSASKVLTDMSAISAAANAASTVNAVNSASKQSALEYRLGDVLEKQINSRHILGADSFASIDRSLGITGRGFFVTDGIREIMGEQNGFSQNRKTGGVWRTQNAVSENKSLSESGRMQNAVSAKRTAASTNNSFEENADRRGLAEQESGETASSGIPGGCDADTLVDLLCGAFREAAFSMSEGVHY